MILENPLFSLMSERLLANEGQAVQKPFHLSPQFLLEFSLKLVQKKFFSHQDFKADQVPT